MVVTVAIANNKGGVGKSQFTVQLAAALARKQHRVLVVDMDPQANSSRRLGVAWNADVPTPTMSEVIKADQDGVGESVVVACGWVDAAGELTPEASLIDVLPARFDLINRETEAGVVGAVRRLKKALTGWTDDYDVVLIDTRPDLGHLVQMSMAAADSIIIPTDPNYDSVEAAVRVVDFVEKHGVDLGNPGLSISGVVVTRRKNTIEHDYQLTGLKEQFGDLLWNLSGTVKFADGSELFNPPYLPEWSRFAEADSAGASLSTWDDRSSRKTVALYDSVAAQFTKRIINAKEVAA